MPLTKADKDFIKKELAKLPTKADLHDEINRLYMDFLRKISKYHPEEVNTLRELVEAQRRKP